MKSAIAFVWKYRSQHHLITNWHVATGRNAYTSKQETPAAPDMLRCPVYARVGDFGKRQWEIQIRDYDHKPLWLIRSGMGRSVDVMAIPTTVTENEPIMNLYPLNALLAKQLKTTIGMDVFILGYPLGSAPLGFPVWKRGSIASEPDLVRMTRILFGGGHRLSSRDVRSAGDSAGLDEQLCRRLCASL
jgi:hypothetical protein